MTVYLDDWRQPAHLGPVDDRWSHLVADTDEELHAFALGLGMRRAWFQDKPGRPHHGHYDVPERARADAVARGAVEVTWRQLGRMLRDRRTEFARAAATTSGDATDDPGMADGGADRISADHDAADGPGTAR